MLKSLEQISIALHQHGLIRPVEVDYNLGCFQIFVPRLRGDIHVITQVETGMMKNMPVNMMGISVIMRCWAGSVTVMGVIFCAAYISKAMVMVRMKYGSRPERS